MSPEELAAWMARHAHHAGYAGQCLEFAVMQPHYDEHCTTWTVAAELTAERAKVERVREMHRGNHQCIKAGMPWRYLPLEQCPTMRALDGAA